MRTQSAWLLLTGFLSVGCASPRVVAPVTVDCRTIRAAPVTNQDQRLEFRGQGFSVLPPPGEHWCITHSSARDVVFSTSALMGSRLEGPPSRAEMRHTFVVMVMALEVGDAKVDTPEELRAFAERINRSGGRFKTIELQVVPDTSLGVECVRVDSVKEERDNPNAPGVVLLLVERPTLLCRHPHMSPTSVVLIGASERYVQGAVMEGPSLGEARKDQVEAFVHSLRFAPPR